MISEAIRWVSRPGDRIDLVFGVNSTDVKLNWTWELEGSTFRDIVFERQRPDEIKLTEIASRTETFLYTVFDGFAEEYDAKAPATLTLKDVDNSEEYVYTIRLSYLSPGNKKLTLRDQVAVVVYGKKRIFSL